MFKIETFTAATIRSVTKRRESHGDERVNAWTLGLEIEGPNTMLDVIDPEIRHALYKPVEGQDQLPGVEPATPVLRCNHFDRHALITEHEGWTLTVDDTIDALEPMAIGGIKISKVTIEAKQGGTIALRFNVGTSDWNSAQWAWLSERHEEQVWITLMPPKPMQGVIDGSTEAFERDHPDAADLFAAEHGQPGPDDDEGQGDDDGSGHTDVDEAPLPEAETKPRGRRGRRAAEVE